jgi:hypothetical protein
MSHIPDMAVNPPRPVICVTGTFQGLSGFVVAENSLSGIDYAYVQMNNGDMFATDKANLQVTQ